MSKAVLLRLIKKNPRDDKTHPGQEGPIDQFRNHVVANLSNATTGEREQKRIDRDSEYGHVKHEVKIFDINDRVRGYFVPQIDLGEENRKEQRDTRPQHIGRLKTGRDHLVAVLGADH